MTVIIVLSPALASHSGAEGEHRAMHKAQSASPQVLIVSGDAPHAEALASAVQRAGRELNCCASLEEASSLLAQRGYLAVLCEDTLTRSSRTSERVLC